ncbi:MULTISPECIES: hypothetical protein [unclassified Aeromicrobium]|uniref:hypothetical protein n=1 Tax=unclassified Aeromicrobium TaxID=2633570 RepID=UPI002889EBFA|nr:MULTISPECIES: hypothetical protein [unclassified Aeromicrobium]
MPHLKVRAPNHDRNFSLGWLAVAWMEFFCLHGDGDVMGEPVVLGDELTGLTVDAYALHPPGKSAPSQVGRRLYDSVFYCRPKGADKSGQGARFGLFEAFGPCRFFGIAEGGEVYTDPWGLGFRYVYREGEPMGRHVTTPFVRCMATEEGQTGNVYDTVYFNLTDGLLAGALNHKNDCGLTRVLLPNRGEITPSTASASSKDGGKETFVDFDETHLYTTPELRRMWKTVSRNLRKRKKTAETWFFESTTMFGEGENSIAEQTLKFAEAIRDGRSRAKPTQLIDWRWGECDDITDRKKLREAIVEAYGDAAEYNDIDGFVEDFYDIRNDEEDSRRYFLNARTTHSAAFIRREWWDGVKDATKPITKDDAIVLGFDGSRRRARGVTDATALVACRVEDGHLQPLKVWAQPDRLKRDGEGKPIPWSIPHTEVDAFVRQVMDEYYVVGFFADPAKWESYVAAWERDFAKQLKIKSSSQHPIEWWMIGAANRKVAEALQSFVDAVVEKQLTHSGDETLTAHIMNAHRRPNKVGFGINKANPDSPDKIDAAIAAVLAYQARLIALSRGVGKKRAPRRQPQRLR